MHIRDNIWKFYIYHSLYGVAFFAPIMVLFWQENGLSMTEIMLLQSIFSIAVVLLEVPTGYFSDIYGRKKSLIYAGGFLSLATIVYSLGTNFWMFLSAELLWGIGLSLVSGTDAAFVYDSLKEMKKEHKFQEVWGKAIFYCLIALAISNIIGGFIATYSYRLTLVINFITMFFMIPIALSFKEPKCYHKLKSSLVLKKAFSLLKHKKIRWLIIYSGVTYGFFQSALWFYQPYFQLTGLQIVYFGFVFASFQLVAGLSSRYASKIENTIGKKNSLILLVLIIGASYLLMGNILFIASFTFAYLQQFVRGFSKVVLSDYVNTLTASNIRATVLSVQNLAGRLFYALIIPIFGYLADVYSLVQALEVIGLTTFVLGFAVLWMMHQARVL